MFWRIDESMWDYISILLFWLNLENNMVKDIGMDEMHKNKGTVACKGGTLTLELSEHHYTFKNVLGENGSKITYNVDRHHLHWHLKLQEDMKAPQWKQSNSEWSSDWKVTQKLKVRIKSTKRWYRILCWNIIVSFISSKQTL